MVEKDWVEAQLLILRMDHKKIFLSFIKPVLDELEEKKLLKTFHFLFEPGPRLLFRIRSDKPQEVKSIIKRNLKGKERSIILKPDEPYRKYEGEELSFGGEKEWELTQKFFEYGCRISLLRVEKITKQELKNFNEGKFIHCFLNQCGYDYIGESLFYHHASLPTYHLGISQEIKQIENLNLKKRSK